MNLLRFFSMPLPTPIPDFWRYIPAPVQKAKKQMGNGQKIKIHHL